MKVLITGADGQLGHDLVSNLSNHHQAIGLNRKQLDVTDIARVSEVVQTIRPDVVIHAAACTHVDQAEQDPDIAYLINTYGTRNVTAAAQQMGAKMIYISTDYVFDGHSNIPYQEYDRVNPLNVYGKSKLAGEEMVKTLSDRYFIVRTSWLFGKHRNNFVKTMLKLAEDQKEVSVVDDQLGSPTYSWDLACFLADLSESDKFGIYHASNSGACSWYEFAKAIFAEAGLETNVIPISTAQIARPARRPAFSVLGHTAIRLNGFSDFRHWKDSVKSFIGELRG